MQCLTLFLRQSATSEPAQFAPQAVTTAARLDVLPDIPTVGDLVPGYEASGWQGVGAPKRTPTEIVDKLNGEINAGLSDPRIKARLADLGAGVFASSSADFRNHIGAEIEKWSKVGSSRTSSLSSPTARRNIP
jgi:tripartite-type tricarboxylate transporter receptor subunit TctC